MLPQTTLNHHKVTSISSTTSYSRPLQFQSSQFTLPKTLNYRTLPSIITCSSRISQVHNYGTVDYERRPIVKWNSLYKRISLMENPESGAGSVLSQWEKEGKKLTKWELCRVVKELRKFKRFKQALEVYNWMGYREERFRLSTSDAAIQLDLIAKVHGVSSAEDFFMRLPEGLKDKRIYGALLNAYVRARMKEKAESLIDTMRDKGYASHSLPFNVIMTLYMNLKEYEKVDLMVSEMMEKNILLDVYTYNIWLSSCGSQGTAERMEEVFDQMKRDRNVNPNWTTFSTMATMYIKMGLTEKAEDCLRRVESRVTGRDRIPYHYLLSLYGNVGNKDEVYRVWNIYKSVFATIPNLGYHAVISSLVRIGDVDGAEKIYQEWLSIKLSYDPRIGNLLLGWYVKDGNLNKAESFFEHIIEAGGKPNSNTWELLAEVHIKKKKISEAFSCFKEAFTAEGSASWKPKPVNVSSFLELCKEEGKRGSKDVFEALLRESGSLKDHDYASLIGMSPADDKESSNKDNSGNNEEDNKDNSGNNEEDEENNESEVVLSDLYDSL